MSRPRRHGHPPHLGYAIRVCRVGEANQNGRGRTLTGSPRRFAEKSDLIRENPRATEIYQRAMEEAWAAKNELLDQGVPLEFALYLLPNAKAIRLVEFQHHIR